MATASHNVIIDESELEPLADEIRAKYRTDNTHNYVVDIEDQDYGTAFRWFFLFHHWPDLLTKRFPTMDEASLFYNAYYWFQRYNCLYIARHGADAGLEQQGFQLLENADFDIDWAVVEKLDREASRELKLPALTDAERATYEWQMWVADFGEAGQRRLKASSALVSRCGGVGGTVAYFLAAAGIGRLVLAHAGAIKPSDLNRQILMTEPGLGTLRVESAARRLRELNPRLEVVPVNENIAADNVARLVGQVDLVADCAPLFAERFLMNQEAVRQRKPLVDSAMYELEAQLTTIVPGQTPCLACLYPAEPPAWKRQFPVFGAVAGSIGCLAAMEVIKVLAGFGEPLLGRLLIGNLRDMTFRTVNVHRNPACLICGDAERGA